MHRRSFCRALGSVGAIPIVGRAQPARPMPVVGFLTMVGEASFEQFRKTMAELGYVEGRNVVYERRSSQGKPERLPTLAAQLVALGVDVLYATSPAAVQAAHAATSKIPIVAFDLETDPVASGLVRSLGSPGGNLTGLFLDHPELAGKWLELLLRAVPGRKRVHTLWDSTTGRAQLDATQAAAQRLGLELGVLEMAGQAGLQNALDRAVAQRAEALVLLSSPVISGQSRRIAEFTLGHRLPGISAFRAFAEGGGLLSYGPNLVEFRRFAAIYVDKIIHGAQPAELPIQRPTAFEFVVNLKTAKALGLTIPPSLALGADEVIQ